MSLVNVSFGISSPCKVCTKREIGCHSQCLDYYEYKKALEEVKRKEREDSAFRTYHIETLSKMIRRKNEKSSYKF